MFDNLVFVSQPSMPSLSLFDKDLAENQYGPKEQISVKDVQTSPRKILSFGIDMDVTVFRVDRQSVATKKLSESCQGVSTPQFRKVNYQPEIQNVKISLTGQKLNLSQRDYTAPYVIKKKQNKGKKNPFEQTNSKHVKENQILSQNINLSNQNDQAAQVTFGRISDCDQVQLYQELKQFRNSPLVSISSQNSSVFGEGVGKFLQNQNQVTSTQRNDHMLESSIKKEIIYQVPVVVRATQKEKFQSPRTASNQLSLSKLIDAGIISNASMSNLRNKLKYTTNAQPPFKGFKSLISKEQNLSIKTEPIQNLLQIQQQKQKISEVQNQRLQRLIKLTQKVTPLQINQIHNFKGCSYSPTSQQTNKKELNKELQYAALPPGKKIKKIGNPLHFLLQQEDIASTVNQMNTQTYPKDVSFQITKEDLQSIKSLQNTIKSNTTSERQIDKVATEPLYSIDSTDAAHNLNVWSMDLQPNLETPESQNQSEGLNQVVDSKYTPLATKYGDRIMNEQKKEVAFKKRKFNPSNSSLVEANMLHEQIDIVTQLRLDTGNQSRKPLLDSLQNVYPDKLLLNKENNYFINHRDQNNGGAKSPFGRYHNARKSSKIPLNYAAYQLGQTNFEINKQNFSTVRKMESTQNSQLCYFQDQENEEGQHTQRQQSVQPQFRNIIQNQMGATHNSFYTNAANRFRIKHQKQFYDDQSPLQDDDRIQVDKDQHFSKYSALKQKDFNHQSIPKLPSMPKLPSLKYRDISPSFSNNVGQSFIQQVKEHNQDQTFSQHQSRNSFLDFNFLNQDLMKLHKHVTERKIELYEKRKLDADRTWKTPHGRQFKVEKEYKPISFRDFTDNPNFENPLIQNEKILSGMHNPPPTQKILKLSPQKQRDQIKKQVSNNSTVNNTLQLEAYLVPVHLTQVSSKKQDATTQNIKEVATKTYSRNRQQQLFSKVDCSPNENSFQIVTVERSLDQSPQTVSQKLKLIRSPNKSPQIVSSKRDQSPDESPQAVARKQQFWITNQHDTLFNVDRSKLD